MTNFEVNLSHYSDAERVFAKQVVGWFHQADKKSVLTVFLNPQERKILTELAKHIGISVHFNGGYQNAENKRALIGNDEENNFQISLLQLNYASNYVHLHHSTVLGSLLHHGISYDRIGDVIHENDNWQLLIDSALADFVTENVKRAGSKKVNFEKIPFEKILNPQSDEKEKEIVISSQRIDLLISQIYNFSRAHAKDLIESGEVMVNWFENDNTSYLAKLGDVVSTHGYGRIRLIATRGTTNRNKIRLKIGIVGKG
ncbi:cell division protein [Oenococcus sp. UCMA 17063]|nr:cell division protein [Oenococcus sp. UCMA 17063]